MPGKKDSLAKTKKSEVGEKRAYNRTVENNTYRTIDDLLLDCCLTMNLGELLYQRENGSSIVKHRWVYTLMFDSIWGMDIDCIEQVIYRIDGTVPSKKERGEFANILGNAIGDVMEYPQSEMLELYPTDPVIIGMAKVVIAISTQETGTNLAKKKSKIKATEMVLSRAGGRNTEPTKVQLLEEYTSPDWMKSLPE